MSASAELPGDFGDVYVAAGPQADPSPAGNVFTDQDGDLDGADGKHFVDEALDVFILCAGHFKVR